MTSLRFQKDELVRALKYLSPAVTLKGQGNESMIGFEVLPNGICLLKAGSNLVRTRTQCAWAGPKLAEGETVSFSIESHYLAKALMTLGVASEVSLNIREDSRIDFILPNSRGQHLIPVSPDEFQSIEDTILDAEVIHSSKMNLASLDSPLKRAMTIWGLVTPAEREASQILVGDDRLMVCAPGFYFIERGSGFPNGLKIQPVVAERTSAFLEKWKGSEATLEIFKTKRWEQTWGVITILVGETKGGADNIGAKWLFSVDVSGENTGLTEAMLARMAEDEKARDAEDSIVMDIASAAELSRQIQSTVAVTEDSHVTGNLAVKEGSAALVFSSKNAMAAKSTTGVHIGVKGTNTVMEPALEWKVSVMVDVLSTFGKGPVTIKYNAQSRRTYVLEMVPSSVQPPREAFISHIGRITPTAAKPREERVKKVKKTAVVIGGAEEGFDELMDSVLSE